jgi:hypothetical protein
MQTSEMCVRRAAPSRCAFRYIAEEGIDEKCFHEVLKKEHPELYPDTLLEPQQMFHLFHIQEVLIGRHNEKSHSATQNLVFT